MKAAAVRTCDGPPADVGLRPEDADVAGDGLRGQLVVAGDHDHADARVLALRDGVRHLRRMSRGCALFLFPSSEIQFWAVESSWQNQTQRMIRRH